MNASHEPNDRPLDPAPGPPPPLVEEVPTQAPTISPAPVDRQREVNNWAVFTHLSALAGFLGIPAGNILGPLLIWLIKKESLPEIDEHGKEALNFQITMLIALALSIPLIFVVIGFFIMIAIGVIQLIFTIVAGIKASEGTVYRYPLSIRFIS